jgi:hypothetical protein
MQPDPEYIMLDLPDSMPPVCCTIRRSLKAKRFFLRVCPHPFSVQLVIPKRRSVASARKFAESKTSWLAATIRRLAPEPGAMPRGPDAPRRIPAELELRLTGERLLIAVEETPGAEVVRCWYDPLFRQIAMRGDPADGKEFAQAFLSVLTQIAEPVLTARIRAHAAALELPEFRVLVHPQKSRWGSCSATGRVTLNTLLMLFPPEAVDYVILHELCHKFEMNHSERFKRKMDELCPDWRERDALLRRCAKELPDFLL